MKKLLPLIALLLATFTLTQAQVVSTLAGTGIVGSNNSPNAKFNNPIGVAVDVSGNVFITDHLNNLIRKITPAGQVSTFAGSGTQATVNGTGILASFNRPAGICIDNLNNIYVSDHLSHVIRKITPAGVATIFAGANGISGSTDATVATNARFNLPFGLCADATGNIYVADQGNQKIRKITPAGVVTTFAGSGTIGSLNAIGTAAQFFNPTGICIDPMGILYVADQGNHKIRKIDTFAVVSTLAGSGSIGSADGIGTATSFHNPTGVFADANSNVFVVDFYNNKIRKISPLGIVCTFAGSGVAGAMDGNGLVATFENPLGIGGNPNGNIYVADYGSHKIRKITNGTNPCTWQMVSTQAAHNLGIKADGTLWAWGWNEYLQIGDGTNINRFTPTKISADNDWASVSAGEEHSLALKSDGSLWAWGWNGYGQLGDGTIISKTTPTRIGVANDWAKIEAGDLLSFAIKQDGTLWAWGYNNFGQLGDGTTTNNSIPTRIGLSTDYWQQISSSKNHVLAIKQNGTLWAWGRNQFGQLGDNSTVIKLVPTPIGASTWKAIAAGYNHSLAINSNGTLWGWGRNTEYEIGDNTAVNKLVPTLADASTNWESLSTSFYGSSGLKNVGGISKSLWVWGAQFEGHFGNGVTGYSTIPMPTQVGTATNWAGNSMGEFHQLFMTNTGELYSAGSNISGELGTGNSANSTIPVSVYCPNFPLNRCYVNYNATTGANNGTSWANAFLSLESALQAARYYNIKEIWVAKGTYKPSAYPQNTTGSPVLTNRDFTFHLVDGVKMYGGFAGSETAISQRVVANETILSGDLLGNDTPFVLGANLANKSDNCYHVVLSIFDCNCTLLDGFTIKNGQADGISLANFITVEGTSIFRIDGGGLYLESSPIEINKITIEENFAEYGAGLTNFRSSCKITYSIFNYNLSSQDGGGIFTGIGSPIISNSIFCNNKSRSTGGAILSSGSVFYPLSTPQIINTTFSNNVSTNLPLTGGIYNDSQFSKINAVNSIFWGSGDGVSDNGTASTVTNCIIPGTIYPGNSSGNPLFANANASTIKGIDGLWRTADDGLRLNVGSPAINTGNGTAVINTLTDITGANRFQGITVDMGAYEYSTCVATISGFWNNPAIWSCGHVPTTTDNAVIAPGVTVIVPNGSFPAHSLTVNGFISYNLGGVIILYP